ncbi:MAG: GrpB family protein [Microbacteriaceae bacterium]|nr:GrpB family protein [Microbacteriaceae bacterium]
MNTPLRWPRLALAQAEVPVMAIEHVGSMSVPGLAAKPIIDCDIVVDAAHVDAASAVLIALGFTLLGELGIPQRWAFAEPERMAGTNTYVVVADSLALRNHLAVRDTLRADSALRDEYGSVKKRVAARSRDIYDYGPGKNAMVQRILKAAGMGEAERTAIDGNQIPIRR